MIVTRFAPSPTGYLHLGHAYAALFAAHASREGRFLLRIEDIDPIRCKEEYVTALCEDLSWLGLTWPEPIRRQSQHMDDYSQALDVLRDKGLLYPCFCTRREIMRDAQGAAHAPQGEGEPFIYPGTCRRLSIHERAEKLAQLGSAHWRIDSALARRMAGDIFWHDYTQGKIRAQGDLFGDVVIARKDVPTSYHLSVTVDDHRQGVTVVTRGMDLLASTHIHRLLQALLGYETPYYHHHILMTDEVGHRLAKQDQSISLRSLRAAGVTVETLRGLMPAFI